MMNATATTTAAKAAAAAAAAASHKLLRLAALRCIALIKRQHLAHR